MAQAVASATAAVASRRRPRISQDLDMVGGVHSMALAHGQQGQGQGRKRAAGGQVQVTGQEDKGGARHQNDPLAIEKLLQEPGGGYKEPKGGAARWVRETLLEGKAAPVPQERLQERLEQEHAARAAEAWSQALAAAPRAFTLPDGSGESGSGGMAVDGHGGAGGGSASGGGGRALVGGVGGAGAAAAPGDDGRKWITVGDNGVPIGEDEEDGELKAAFKVTKQNGRVVPGFYPKGVVLHKDWRPSVGYEPVDTSAVDACRPAYQVC